MKKIISILLCIAIFFSIGITAFAEFSKPAQDTTALVDSEKTINSYLTAKCQSVKNLQYIDFSNLFNLQDKGAKSVYSYEVSRTKYAIESLKSTGDRALTSCYSINILNYSVSGSTVKITANVSIENEYSYMPGNVQIDNNTHIFTLTSKNGNMLIVNDEYTDEFRDCYNCEADLVKLVSNIPQELAAYNIKQASNKSNEKNISITRSVPGDTYVAYNRTAAANYARQYSTNYNTNFISFAASHSDCQNFVSQCVWSGFGGVNNSTSINSHAIPMISYNWYADKTNCVSNWSYIPSFTSLITSNYNSNGYGVRGYYENIGNVRVGDLIVDPGGGHIMIVSSATDSNGNGVTDWSEIYICAHTNDRTDSNLRALYGSSATPPVGMKFIGISNFLYNTGA